MDRSPQVSRISSPATQGEALMMPGNSPSAAAVADDASLIRRTLIPVKLEDKPFDALSPVGGSYASPILHADSLGVCDVMESQQASRSGPDDPGQDLREGAHWKVWRLPRKASYTAEDLPVSMPITEPAVRDRSSPQPKLQRWPIKYPRPRNAWHASLTLNPSHTRYLGPSRVPQYARRPSPPFRKEHRSFHLQSRHGTNGIQAFSNSDSASRDLRALAFSVAAFDLMAILTQSSCRARRSNSDMGYVAANSTPTAQATDIAIGVARGGPVCLWKGACAITSLKGLPYDTPSLISGSGSRERSTDWSDFVSLPRLSSHRVQSPGMPKAEIDLSTWNLNQEMWS